MHPPDVACGSKQKPLDGTDAAMFDGGNVLERHAMEVSKYEKSSLQVGQRIDAPAHSADQLTLFRHMVWRVPRIAITQPVGCRFAGCAGYLRFQTSPANPPAVNCVVLRHSVEPGRKPRSFRAPLRHGTVQLQKNLLGRILGIFGIFDDAIGGRKHSTPVTPVKL